MEPTTSEVARSPTQPRSEVEARHTNRFIQLSLESFPSCLYPLSDRHLQIIPSDTSNDDGCSSTKNTHTHKPLIRARTRSANMSDNTIQLQMGVLGFSEHPGLVRHLIDDKLVDDLVSGGGNGPSAVHQRWFVFRDGQFRPARPVTPGLNRQSNSDPGASRQRNIRFITVLMIAGPDVGQFTDDLDACINSGEMDQFASRVAEHGSRRIIMCADASGQESRQLSAPS